jgi:TPR repeat protein
VPALGELERYWFGEGERLSRQGAGAAARAYSCYRKAAELGHRRAALITGDCLRHGVGVAADPAQALLWYGKAATLFEAKIALGDLYYYGIGVKANFRESFRWYEQAAGQQEDSYAMYSVGYCLLYGQGTSRDATGAVRWLRRAAQLGRPDAQYELGCAYYRGNKIAADGLQAARWLKSAAALGHDKARAFLERINSSRPLN